MNDHALEIAHSYVGLGATYNELKGDLNNMQAIECYNKALTIYEYHHAISKRYRASALNNLANAYRDLNNEHIPRAITYLNSALELFSELPNDLDCQREQAKIFYNQGVNYYLLGGLSNRHVALDFLNKAKSFFKSHDDIARYALTLSYLGNVYKDMGVEYIITAIDCLKDALCIQKKFYSENHPEVAVTLGRLEVAVSASE